MEQLLELERQIQKLRASDVLRHSSFEQIRFNFSGGKDSNKRCAMGVLMSHIGWDGDIENGKKDNIFWQYFDKAKEYFGIENSYPIQKANDYDELSFEQIADKLDYQFYDISRIF